MKRKKDFSLDITREAEQNTGGVESLEYATVTLTFGITKDEAEAVVKYPNGTIAKKLKQYLNKVLSHLATQFLEQKKRKRN